MPGPPTPNLGLTPPTIGSDIGSWGAELNGNIEIIDELGAAGVINTSTNINAAPGIFPETFIRVTTGVATVIVALPSPASCFGRIFTVLKVDSGSGQVSIVPTIGTISGNSSYLRTMQGGYVRLLSNGSSYDVIGNN
jgi:hypothetical protein